MARSAQDSAKDKERQRSLERERTDFLDMAAHQLYTPLTPLLVDLRLLERRLEDRDDEALVDVVKRVHRNAERLRRIVHDVADAAHIGAHGHRLELTRVDLDQVVRRVVDACRSEAKALRIRIDASGSGPVPIQADEPAIEHLVYQLISNAMRFTPAGGQVGVHVVTNEGGQVVLTVRDNGLGLSEEQRVQAFGPFIQPNDPLHGRGGTGLGLFVARLIARAHGGTLRAGPVEGRGSVFTLTLPPLADAPGMVYVPTGRR